MSIKEASVEAPKKSKRASKKNKKSWRKNTSIEDIEEFLEDQRLEERLGGAFDKRKDEDLFIVDSKPKDDEKEVIISAKSKKKARAEKPLKCYQYLTNTSGVSDPISKRNRRRLDEERKNPIVVSQEIARRKNGVVKAKEKLAKSHRAAEQLRKASTQLERTTRRRTEFEFDLWSTSDHKDVGKVKSNEWLESQTKTHTLKNTGKIQKKIPNDFRDKTSLLPSVEVPHGGASYNPSLKDHQDLLLKAALVELNKEKEKHKIEYHTTRMFPDAKDAPTLKTWLQEMSEGVDVLNRKKSVSQPEDEQVEDDGEPDEGMPSEDDDDEEMQGEIKVKTRKQRRKEKERKIAEKKRLAEKAEQMKNSEVYRIKSINREISEMEKSTAEKIAKRKAAKAAKMHQPATLSGHKFEEPELEIKLSDELTGNLRSLKPEGNLLEDRFKSLQKRNIIQTTVKHKIVRNKKKRKKVEKRNYKMGFSWEK